MKFSGRLAGIAGVLLLCQLAGPAFADPTPEPTPVEAVTVIECPPAERVAAALGREVTSTVADSRDCQYSARGAGLVQFRLETMGMAELRAAADATGTPVTEVPSLAPGAFATSVGNNWVLRFPAGSEAATLAVPTVLQSGATHLAEEMLAATSSAAGATPPPPAEDDCPGMPRTGD